MTTSLIINTNALGDPTTRAWSGRPYTDRAYALRNFILPMAITNPHVDEVIVVGEWEPGDGYTYVEVPNETKSCIGALDQRHAGYLASRGDWLIFQHDDHYLDLHRRVTGASDVVVPIRRTRLRYSEGELLSNGSPNYISGHCAVYRREVIRVCPWCDVGRVRTWDIEHTKQIKANSFSIEYARGTTPVAWDVEAGSEPWQ